MSFPAVNIIISETDVPDLISNKGLVITHSLSHWPIHPSSYLVHGIVISVNFVTLGYRNDKITTMGYNKGFIIPLIEWKNYTVIL